MERVDEVRKFVQAVDMLTLALSTKLEPILKKSLDELLLSTASLHQQILLLNNFTYTLIAIIFAYIKVQGISTDSHPVMKELGRIKASMARYKELVLRTALSELEQDRASKKAQRYLQNTLGVKSGLGGAVSESAALPAISSQNFTGKHTKFTTEDTADESTQSSSKSNDSKKPKNLSKNRGNSKKVTKPQKSKRKNEK